MYVVPVGNILPPPFDIKTENGVPLQVEASMVFMSGLA